MRLLILTQKVDVKDPVLGFFHGWIEEFSRHCEALTVICLQVGEHSLPANVKVLSLGKDERVSRVTYIYRFYKYIWRERNSYDTVFVHMNQEYVLLGGFFWRFFKKKITMWRNHPLGDLLTKVAVFLAHKVFCTSEYSYTARFKKTSIMPVGVNTELFFQDTNIEKKKHSILFLGRISPVKQVDVFVEALIALDKQGMDFVATVCGNFMERDRAYYERVRSQAFVLEEKKKISFIDGVPNTQTPLLYNQHEIFVNLTPSGSFDKTILEAMACECLVLASNESLKGVLPEPFLFKENDVIDLAKKLKAAILLSSEERRNVAGDLREFASQHSIARLAEQLFIELSDVSTH